MNMISKFDSFLIEEYYNVIELLKENTIDLELKSEHLLLMLISKKDSLFNCFCKVDINKCIKLIKGLDFTDTKYEAKDIIELSYSIALKDKGNKINDEHLLYGLLMFEEYKPVTILKCLNIDYDNLKQQVEDYFCFEENEYLINMTDLAKKNKFSQVIGRKEYIKRIIRVLNKKQKNNCLLIGNAGVGKSCLVEGVTMELLKLNPNITVYRLELGALVAGTRYRGDLEERLVNILEEVKNINVIVFIDEIHNIVGGKNNEDTINIANILKPALARNEIKCIGATTLDEYYKFISKDKALVRRFQNIFIPEATKEETIEILLNIKQKYQDFYNVIFPKKIINKLVDECDLMPNRKYPDKAIDLLDEVGAYTKELNKKIVTEKILKKIVLENIGINKQYYSNKRSELNDYYQDFLNGKQRKNILNLKVNDKKDIVELAEEIKKQYNLTKESIFYYDLEVFNETIYEKFISNIIKYPIILVVFSNYQKANFYVQKRIDKIIELGYGYDQNGSIVYLNNVIFIFYEKSLNKSTFGFIS